MALLLVPIYQYLKRVCFLDQVVKRCMSATQLQLSVDFVRILAARGYAISTEPFIDPRTPKKRGVLLGRVYMSFNLDDPVVVSINTFRG